MSDVMLHGVLRMPPDCWDDGYIDQQQRYNRYVEASDRIQRQDDELEQLRAENARLKDELSTAKRAVRYLQGG